MGRLLRLTSMAMLAMTTLVVSAKADFYQIVQPNNAISGSDPTAYTSGTTKISISSISDYTNLSSITNGTQTVSFSETLTKGQVPGGGWASWNNPPATESGVPPVLITDASTTLLTLNLQVPSSTFGIEIQPSTTANVTASFYQGSTLVGSITNNVNSTSGALLFAATSYSNPFTIVTVSVPAAAQGFAMAQFRYSTTSQPVPEPASIALIAQACAAAGFYTWRKRRKTA